MMKNCQVCGLQYEIVPARANISRFCSWKCLWVHRTLHGTIARECYICGKEIRVRKSRVKTSRKIFCGKKCYHQLQGDNRYNWIALPVDAIRELYSQGKSCKEIAATYNTSPQTVARRLRACGISLRCRPPNPFKFNEMTSDLAYAIGVRFGDGGFDSDRHFSLCVRDKEFAEETFNRLENLDLRPSLRLKTRDAKPWYKVRVSSKEFCSWLVSVDLKFLESNLTSQELVASFLRGFYDSEGSLSHNRKGGYTLVFYNTNQPLLEFVSKLLGKLSFTPRLYLLLQKEEVTYIRGRSCVARKDRFMLTLRKKDEIRKFCEMVGSSIPRKVIQPYQLCHFTNIQIQRKVTSRQCPTCGITFKPKENARKFCSPGCWYTWRTKNHTIVRNCPACDKEITVRKSEAALNKKSFCNWSCYQNFRRKVSP